MDGTEVDLTVAVDFGSTFTKLVAIDIAGERIVATAQARTTVDSDVTIGFDQALAQLDRALAGKPYSIDRYLASSSAAGGLRMIAIGLIPALTAEAARRAALCAGAKLLDVFCNRMTRREVARLEADRPEIVLLVGGTDGGNTDVVRHNAVMLAASGLSAPIVYAGNKVASDEVEATLRAAGKDVSVTDNVMPQIGTLDIDPARAVVRDIFMRRIVEAKGIAKVRGRVGDILMPTPMAVLQAAELLADGFEGEPGLGELIVFDVGGATTDVHSIAKGEPTGAGWIPRGLPEPYAKRTVEGDLGLRWNATSIVEAAGLPKVQGYMSGTEPVDIPARAQALSANPDTVPVSDSDYAFDTALAAAAVDLAIERHAGQLETVYGTSGPVTLLYGKDLSAVRHVIGVGGVFARGRGAGTILSAALAKPDTPLSTRPKSAGLAIDKDYIFCAMGLLATHAPRVALRLMKRHLQPVSNP
jgi:uncharacterized protein (TIGR01319 family)